MDFLKVLETAAAGGGAAADDDNDDDFFSGAPRQGPVVTNESLKREFNVCLRRWIYDIRNLDWAARFPGIPHEPNIVRDLRTLDMGPLLQQLAAEQQKYDTVCCRDWLRTRS